MDKSIKELLLKDIREASTLDERALAIRTYQVYSDTLLTLEHWHGKE